VNYAHWNATRYFFDPDGNVVEYIARHVNNSDQGDLPAKTSSKGQRTRLRMTMCRRWPTFEGHRGRDPYRGGDDQSGTGSEHGPAALLKEGESFALTCPRKRRSGVRTGASGGACPTGSHRLADHPFELSVEAHRASCALVNGFVLLGGEIAAPYLRRMVAPQRVLWSPTAPCDAGTDKRADANGDERDCEPTFAGARE